MEILGSCHCGNISWRLETQKSWADVLLRICRCDFCLRHRPRYWSDPQGRLELEVAGSDAVLAYRFGHGTADFLICRGCGVFCLAVTDTNDGPRAVLNMNLALGRDDAPPETFLEALDESEAERNQRRAQAWTPVVSGWRFDRGG